MENLGYLTVLLGFCLSVYAALAALVGKWRRNAFLELSAQRAVAAMWLMVTSATVLLLYAIFTDDFRLSYVSSRSNLDLPGFYKFAALWGGQEGSLLFWSWILATYSFIAVYLGRRAHRDMISYVVAIMMSVQAFFLMLIAFIVSPFQVLMSGSQITPMADGNGLNPLLQHPLMAIHPPMLYLGYVGFAVPFAFAMASLITRQPGDRWIHTTRIWTMVTWLFQACGILLGARWSYDVLGWGGYWAWDPVENASLLPWITATAFLHSVMMQEKKGMMKVWNVVLVSATFLLCIFGTMLTRTGMVSSVHAFAQSPIGPYFNVYLTAMTAFSVFLILSRLDYLKSENELDSVVSRESSFLFNNVILLASCFAVLWGTMFPVISEAFTNEKISVGAPFFNRVNIPIALVSAVADRCRSAVCLAPHVGGEPAPQLPVAGGDFGRAGRRLVRFGDHPFLRPHVLRPVHVRRHHDCRRVLSRSARHPAEAGYVARARDGRVDASQYTALRRVSRAYGGRGHVHRFRRVRLQPGNAGRDECRRQAAPGPL